MSDLAQLSAAPFVLSKTAFTPSSRARRIAAAGTRTVDPGLWYAWQLSGFGNACGAFAAMHAMANAGAQTPACAPVPGSQFEHDILIRLAQFQKR